jgi:hypothetical protein
MEKGFSRLPDDVMEKKVFPGGSGPGFWRKTDPESCQKQ